MAIDLMREFLNEAHEQLDMLEQLFLKLEEKDARTIDAIFRIAHTLKGSAACVGLKDVAGFSHKMETLLDSIRKGEVVISESVCNLLLQSGDVLRALIHGVEEGLENYVPPEYNTIMNELEHASERTFISKEDNNDACMKLFVRIGLDRASEMRAARAFVILKRLEDIGRLKFSRPSENELLNGQVVPDAMIAVVEGDIEDEALYECITGYPDVTDVEVRYMVEVRESNWVKYMEYGRVLESKGKRIVLDFIPSTLKIDGGTLSFLGEALRHGWLLHSNDDLTFRVLNRITLKQVV
ncbi:Hpt domain-containing protein [Neomoorella mulderi]|uniref:Chemotaxis protein CheA n=1 Tax=Moorella mulderi DSM 14980 TaxID=1122241 RepID=A0A151ASJ4_9FIRM|nr:Hpt domain-containing protein [Moorella mulderi]KYH30585.1 chemotaxis protein CheA [Moorella mulderi DSM 14980]